MPSVCYGLFISVFIHITLLWLNSPLWGVIYPYLGCLRYQLYKISRIYETPSHQHVVCSWKTHPIMLCLILGDTHVLFLGSVVRHQTMCSILSIRVILFVTCQSLSKIGHSWWNPWQKKTQTSRHRWIVAFWAAQKLHNHPWRFGISSRACGPAQPRHNHLWRSFPSRFVPRGIRHVNSH
jgi:hypothetical protein